MKLQEHLRIILSCVLSDIRISVLGRKFVRHFVSLRVEIDLKTTDAVYMKSTSHSIGSLKYVLLICLFRNPVGTESWASDAPAEFAIPRSSRSSANHEGFKLMIGCSYWLLIFYYNCFKVDGIL